MNRAHRIADQVRSVVGWLNRVPAESQFLSKGFLSPAEFVEAGDQLVFQCPSWQWQGCHGRRKQVFWLPPTKQYLLTRNIPCRHRVTDWDRSYCKQAHITAEGWLVPGPQPNACQPAEEPADRLASKSVDCKVKTADGHEVNVRHGDECDELSSSSASSEEGSSRQLSESAIQDFVEIGEEGVVAAQYPGVDDFTVIGGGGSASAAGRRKGKKSSKSHLVPTRSYDLSITYDKYYQTPRLWLFGFDESGVPLRADAVFEDIQSDYLSKTVTVDPHPFTGVPTVSVHPCKHASVMRNVAQNWLKSGIVPRHDLALFVLLKMVSSVVPTINYDFTIDIEMPIGAALEDDAEDACEESVA